MPLLDTNGRLFGKFNVLDAGLVLLLAIGALGVFLVQSNLHATSKAMVQGETDIDIRVMFTLRSEDAQLLKAGEMTNITIRNQPRGEVKILDVQKAPVQVMLAVNGKPTAVTDTTEKNVQSYWVTLRDHATITKEGYVAEGVKIKVGVPVDLEGFKYFVHGGIVDVRPVAEAIGED
jgi:ribosomal protein S1